MQAMKTITNTMMVVTVVSLRVGHVTFCASARKETTVTTIMVFVMVVVASIFFLLADQVMRIAVSFLLGINT